MKKETIFRRLPALLILFTALYLTGCSNNFPVSVTECTEAPIGGDWHVFRGYGNDTYETAQGEALLSLMDFGHSFGYYFYSTADGSILARILIRTSDYTADDLDLTQGWMVYCQDFDQDGFQEFGVPMADGTVLWYCFRGSVDYVFCGSGTPQSLDQPA